VLEGVVCRRRLALAEDQLGPDQLPQRVSQRAVVQGSVARALSCPP
jgi:hypothetical protein